MDIPIIMYFLSKELEKRKKDELFLIRKNELQVIYDVLNFILTEFTKNIYPETMLTNIYEHLVEHFNYDIWSGKGGLNE